MDPISSWTATLVALTIKKRTGNALFAVATPYLASGFIVNLMIRSPNIKSGTLINFDLRWPELLSQVSATRMRSISTQLEWVDRKA